MKWSSGRISNTGAVIMFQDVNLFQPYRQVLRQLLELGLPIMSNSIYYHFVVEGPGLFLALHGDDAELFSGVSLMAPSVIAEVFSHPDDPYQPFISEDFDRLPTYHPDEDD